MNKMADFADYVLSFYGKLGLYDMGVNYEDVLVATGIRIEARKDIEFQGDSLDRELVRDILIERLGYKWPTEAAA